MERQLLVALLAVLFEQRTAQHRFRCQALPSGVLSVATAQILSHPHDQLRVGVYPQRHRPQLAADLVSGENIE
jgi:hypothetical protein